MDVDEGSRDRVGYLRQLALGSLDNYSGRFAALERVDRDLKSLIRSLEEVGYRSWTGSLLRLWGQLEIAYASALAEGRCYLTQDEEIRVQEIAAALRASLE
ncbi:hypothetical protein [Mycobacterium sp. E3198]|uniref:hypothetical protein n=1 Tax=Mycobacterium sp. E3198 TaxID=1834143 RepID=UPI000801E362|nr:hypothetical protein [Mycobacterium sp. E3198]OBG38458.1 hypothetical protein A5673_14950 [Mycobacterium sp. E3198]